MEMNLEEYQKQLEEVLETVMTASSTVRHCVSKIMVLGNLVPAQLSANALLSTDALDSIAKLVLEEIKSEYSKTPNPSDRLERLALKFGGQQESTHPG